MIGIGLILCACLLWAIDTLIRYPLLGQGIAPIIIVTVEHLILSVLYLPVLIKRRRQILGMPLGDFFSFLVIGGGGSAMATLCFTWAFQYLNPSVVILLQKWQPVVAISLAVVILKERINKRFWGLAFLCFLGSLLIGYQDVHQVVAGGTTMIGMSRDHILGYGLTFLAVLGWGSSTVFGKKLQKKGVQTSLLIGMRFFLGLLVLIPIYFYQTRLVLPLNLDFWGKMLVMVLISGTLAMSLYYLGLKRVHTKVAALAEMSFPFCAVVVNWLFLDRTLDPIQLIGGGLLLVGSSIIQIKSY